MLRSTSPRLSARAPGVAGGACWRAGLLVASRRGLFARKTPRSPSSSTPGEATTTSRPASSPRPSSSTGRRSSSTRSSARRTTSWPRPTRPPARAPWRWRPTFAPPTSARRPIEAQLKAGQVLMLARRFTDARSPGPGHPREGAGECAGPAPARATPWRAQELRRGGGGQPSGHRAGPQARGHVRQPRAPSSTSRATSTKPRRPTRPPSPPIRNP